MNCITALRAVRRGTIAIIAALAASVWTTAAPAGPLNDGTPVRIASRSIEAGWFTGNVRLDQRGCWMVHLDKATKDHYTLLALTTVDKLEISRGGAWTAVSVPALVKAQPAPCLEEGSD